MSKLCTLVVILFTAGACVDVNAPIAVDDAALSRGAGAACVSAPTVVVSDEASLHAAAAAAQPGDVIAVEGTIQLEQGVVLSTPDVTLTCASAGSGLAFSPAAADGVLVYAWADRVSVSSLSLDATGGVYAVYSLATDGQRTTENIITCGNACAFWVGATNALVSGNTVHASGFQTSGLHFQGRRDGDGNLVRRIDGTAITHNTIVAYDPTAFSVFGAIRPRDGKNINVSDNTITGPWSNSISMVNVDDSEFRRNVLEGAQQHGLSFNISGSVFVAFATGNDAVANRVRDAGVSGFLMRNACHNTFHGNPTLGTTPYAFILRETTGANVAAGTAGTSIDNGNWDCDGDGSTDPNDVSGTVITTSTTGTLSVLSASVAAEPAGVPPHGEIPVMQ